MAGETRDAMLPDIRVPAAWTFAGLAAGLALGTLLQGTRALDMARARRYHRWARCGCGACR